MQKIGALSPEPFQPVITALAAIAVTTSRYKVSGDCIAAFMSWLDVIQGVCIGTAICTLIFPSLKDLPSELLFCAAFRDEV